MSLMVMSVQVKKYLESLRAKFFGVAMEVLKNFLGLIGIWFWYLKRRYASVLVALRLLTRI